MEKRRHTDYYIPVLKVLEDLHEYEIHTLISKTADLCKLTEEERQEKTRKGTQLRYESNIQWAITDLCQGGFINRTNRGVYTMAFDGLLMLEDNPKQPNRDYLEAHSEKFRDFRYRKGTRNKLGNSSEGNLFSDIGEESENANNEEKPIAIVSETEISHNAQDLLAKCLKVREDMLGLSLDTTQIDTKIKLLKEGIARNAITKEVKQFLQSVINKKLGQLNLIIDISNNCGKAYILDGDFPDSILSSASMICDCVEGDDSLNSQSAREEGSLPKKDEQKRKRKEEHKNREKRQPSKRLTVIFNDGTILEDKAAADVFAKAIEKCGAEKVAELGLTSNGFPLVGNTPPDKYQYKEIDGGYFIPVNSPTEIKRKFLEKIASRLGIGMQVTVV